MGFKRQATQSQTALFLSSLKIMIILLYLWFLANPIPPDEENHLAAASRHLLWNDYIRTGDSSACISD
jgi:hypothetical protein